VPPAFGKDQKFFILFEREKLFLLEELMKKYSALLLVIFAVLISGCESKKEVLLIATTTSLDNSGLLEYILPVFEEEYNCDVQVVALGTGAALELGRLGEADILLVHDVEREILFVENGYGEKRKDIMYNDFIYVGPAEIPVDNLEDALEFFTKGNHFYSRGDNSGTHAREIAIWNEYGFDIETFDTWYLETGQGMGSTLTMASLSRYYTFTDRGTYLSMSEKLNLVIAYENTPALMNSYGIIKISEELHNRDASLADAFYEWITQTKTLDLVDSYIRYDQQLFFTYREDS